MSTKEVLKEFQDYFTEIEWSEHAVKKVENLLDRFVQANSAKVVKTRYVRKPYSEVDFIAVAEKVCKDHNLPDNAIYARLKKPEYVHARADFIYRVKTINPLQSVRSISKFLRRDRTTILHYLNGIKDGAYKIKAVEGSYN